MFEAVTCVLWPVSIRSTLLHLATALWFAWVMRKIVFASLLQFEVSKVKRLTLLLMTLHALTLCIFKSNMISAKILCEPAKWAAFQLQLTRLKTSGCVIASIVWIFNNVLATGSVAPILIFLRQKLFHGVLQACEGAAAVLDWVHHRQLGLPGSAVPGTRRGGSFKNRTCL